MQFSKRRLTLVLAGIGAFAGLLVAVVLATRDPHAGLPTTVALGPLRLDVDGEVRTKGTYAIGSATRAAPFASTQLAIEWSTGGLLAPEIRANVERVLASELRDPDAAVEPVTWPTGGLASASVIARGTRVVIASTQLLCAGLRFDVRTIGTADDAIAEHQAVIATARCEPDPTHAREAAELPFTIMLPSGWTETSVGTGHAYRGDGATLIVQTMTTVDPDDLSRLLENSYRTSGLVAHLGERESLDGAEGERGLWSLELLGSTTKHVGWVALWRCPPEGLWIFAQLFAPRDHPYTLGPKLLAGIRCRDGASSRQPAQP